MKWTWSPQHDQDHRDDTGETRWNEELDTLTWPLLQAHIRQLAKLNFWLVKEDLSFSRRPTTFAWTTKWVSRDQRRSQKMKEDQRRKKRSLLQQMSHYFSLDQQARFNKCISHKFFPWATIKTISSVILKDWRPEDITRQTPNKSRAINILNIWSSTLPALAFTGHHRLVI